MTAWTRSRTPSFARMLPTWVLTVVTDSTRRSAISTLDSPCATARNTSVSRGVRARSLGSRASSRGGSASGLCGRWCAKRSSMRRTTRGATTELPEATVRIASASSSGRALLRRNPLAPPRSAANAYSSTSNVVTTSTRAAGCSAAIRRVASIPSMPGIRTSMTTTSGARAATCSSATLPSAASPTTARSGSESIASRNPMRSSAWSSTSRTVIIGGPPPRPYRTPCRGTATSPAPASRPRRAGPPSYARPAEPPAPAYRRCRVPCHCPCPDRCRPR
ncbi:hypothetical protein EES47_30170 [Streptomyces sp. ADI98-12]|nr:hypothetical protein EES47_30170 [Streptomyces sp. ADI98-12]